jgi:hypothetical protein
MRFIAQSMLGLGLVMMLSAGSCRTKEQETQDLMNQMLRGPSMRNLLKQPRQAGQDQMDPLDSQQLLKEHLRHMNQLNQFGPPSPY